MAKKTVVHSQMPQGMTPSTTDADGTYGRCTAPFDQPQSMGNGGIPTIFYSGGPYANPKMANSNMSGPLKNGAAVNGGQDRPISRAKVPGRGRR